MKFSRIKIFSLSIVALLLISAAAKTVEAYSWQFADEASSVRLRWKTSRITVAVSSSLVKQSLAIKPDSDIGGAIRRSFEAWEKVANVKFEIIAIDKQAVSAAGKSGDGVSLLTVAQMPENLFLFGGDGAGEVSARTRTFFNSKGIILEADIVLNPYQQFSTDGSIGTFDLEATLTHEIGHLLGLEHSTVPGATMFEHQGKNGIYGLPNLSARTLADDDIAGVRALYGGKIADNNCCGTIAGRLFYDGGKAAKQMQLWVEEFETGRVAAAVTTNADGGFRIEGLTAGKYSVYSQSNAEKKNSVSATAQLLSHSVDVGRNKITNFTKKLKTAQKTFNVLRVGFNSQISNLAIPLNGGKSFLIYVGGTNIAADDIMSVGFNSPFLSFVPNTLSEQDFGGEMTVVSFEVKVNPQTPAGEYSFYLQSKTGETAYSVGSLTVEEFVNPWSVFAFSDDE